MKKAYEQGYFDAIEDVERAMKEAEVTESQLDFAGNIIFNSYNDPKKFVEALKILKAKRFLHLK